MKLSRSLWVSVAFVAVAVGVALWLYPRLPLQTPSHWNLQGQVDGHLPRFWAAAMPALVIASLAALTVLLPAISPRRFEIGSFAPVFALLMLTTQAFMLVVGLSMLLAGAGYAVPMPRIAMLSVGALLMVLGNYMGKLRKNFFIGIRTPWTLSSDAVWERTHRLGGWLFLAAGLLVVLVVALDGPRWLPIVLILAAALVPALYSLLIYRRQEGRR